MLGRRLAAVQHLQLMPFVQLSKAIERSVVRGVRCDVVLLLAGHEIVRVQGEGRRVVAVLVVDHLSKWIGAAVD